MSETIISFLLIASGVFSSIAGIGLLRFPDVYMRMHAWIKAGTLGVGLSVISVAIFFAVDVVSTKIVLIVLFVLLTAPVVAHLIARAAYRTNTPLWAPTKNDDQSRSTKQAEESLSIWLRSLTPIESLRAERLCRNSSSRKSSSWLRYLLAKIGG